MGQEPLDELSASQLNIQRMGLWIMVTYCETSWYLSEYLINQSIKTIESLPALKTTYVKASCSLCSSLKRCLLTQSHDSTLISYALYDTRIILRHLPRPCNLKEYRTQSSAEGKCVDGFKSSSCWRSLKAKVCLQLWQSYRKMKEKGQENI